MITTGTKFAGVGTTTTVTESKVRKNFSAPNLVCYYKVIYILIVPKIDCRSQPKWCEQRLSTATCWNSKQCGKLKSILKLLLTWSCSIIPFHQHAPSVVETSQTPKKNSPESVMFVVCYLLFVAAREQLQVVQGESGGRSRLSRMPRNALRPRPKTINRVSYFSVYLSWVSVGNSRYSRKETWK